MKILMEHPNLGPERRQWVDKEAFDVAWVLNGWVEKDRQVESTDVDSEGVAVVAAAPPARPSWELHDEEGNPIDYSEADAADAKAAAKEAKAVAKAASKENA